MACALLRTSACRGSILRRRVVSAAAAIAPCREEGLAASRALQLSAGPQRRHVHSGRPGDQRPMSLNEKVNLLHQTIRQVNRNMEKGHVVYASVQRLIEEKKGYNPFVQLLWYAGAVITLVVYADHKRLA